MRFKESSIAASYCFLERDFLMKIECSEPEAIGSYCELGE